jgi:SAM-dependent methyltransferase
MHIRMMSRFCPVGRNMATYALDNSWEQAKRRLALLEQCHDPTTQRRINTLGIQPGWRCLEVGAGGGSVAGWLCERVGPTGSVVATDVNTQFLAAIKHVNFEVMTHDITSESLPEGTFDFVHTRALLHHLPDPERVIHRMIDALRPGGWLLLEEPDFFPVLTSTSTIYSEFMTALNGTIVRVSGRDCFWARALPELVAKSGLYHVGGEGDFAVLQGGSPVAEFFRLTAEQMRDRVLASGALSEERLDQAIALLKDPDFWAFTDGMVAVWGQRPT